MAFYLLIGIVSISIIGGWRIHEAYREAKSQIERDTEKNKDGVQFFIGVHRD